MKNFLEMLLVGLAVLLSAGCAVTSSLYPPCAESALITPFPASMTGEWLCCNGKERWSLNCTPNPTSPGTVCVTLVQLDQPPEKASRMMPMVAGVFAVNGRRFVAVAPDVSAVCKENRYLNNSAFLVSPRYFLLTLDDANPERPVLQFASFLPVGRSDKKSLSDKITVKEGLVLNSSAEIYGFLQSGTYAVDATRYELYRPEAKKTQNK